MPPTQFHVFILSDTDVPDVAAEEDRLLSGLIETWRDRLAITYRRRVNNIGFKAGNIREFCERWGMIDYEIAITLDADSVMPAAAVLRLVRVMQADPKLGVVQALVVGMPATKRLRAHFPVWHACSAYARTQSAVRGGRAIAGRILRDTMRRCA